MTSLWSTDKAKIFWQRRKTYLVFNDANQNDKITGYNDTQKRIQKEHNAKTEYLSK
jgi:hypothetical protein